MFPLKDNVPSRRAPLVNISIIIINVFVFIYELSLGPHLEEFIFYYGFTPAVYGYLAEVHPENLPLRIYPLFTSMFLHGGWIHLISNMWSLWIFGDNVEDRMGHFRYVIFYLSCGLIAAIAQFWVAPHARIPMIGASGAIAGVMGAYFFLFPHARVLTLVPIFFFLQLVEIPAFFFLAFWFIMQFFSGSLAISSQATTGGVAWFAHIGGFLGGAILIWVFKTDKRLR